MALFIRRMTFKLQGAGTLVVWVFAVFVPVLVALGEALLLAGTVKANADAPRNAPTKVNKHRAVKILEPFMEVPPFNPLLEKSEGDYTTSHVGFNSDLLSCRNFLADYTNPSWTFTSKKSLTPSVPNNPD